MKNLSKLRWIDFLILHEILKTRGNKIPLSKLRSTLSIEIADYYKKNTDIGKKEVTYTYLYQRIEFLNSNEIIIRRNTYGSGILLKINPQYFEKIQKFVFAYFALEEESK